MISARLPIQKAIHARITAMGFTVVTRATHGQGHPFVIIGDDTEVELRESKTGSSTANTHTIRIYADTMVEAKEIAATISADLMGEALELEDGLTVVDWMKDMDITYDESDENTVVYVGVMRFRFTINRG